MSQENVEIAKRVVEAFNGRDAAAASELTTPDFEWFPAMATSVEGGSYRGDEGIRRYLAEVNETWDELRLVVDEFRELDDERVAVLVHGTGRGKASGLEYSPEMTRTAHLFHVQGGKVVKFLFYLDRDRAHADLGLKE